ncbi:MAG: hypothetical protein QNK11_00410 [Legionella sp.]|nr:hypothetical protein [Legionella sp.]
MRYFYLIISILVITTAVHAEEVYPAACKPFVIHGESVKFPAGTPRVVMLHNLSQFDVWITHSIELNSRLQSNLWSALALDKHAFELSCIESKPGHEQQVSCEETLAVCEWPITTRPKHTKGIVWAGENMPLSTLTAYISRRGFELPQTAQ